MTVPLNVFCICMISGWFLLFVVATLMGSVAISSNGLLTSDEILNGTDIRNIDMQVS